MFSRFSMPSLCERTIQAGVCLGRLALSVAAVLWLVIPIRIQAQGIAQGAEQGRFVVLHGNTRPEAIAQMIVDDWPKTFLLLT